MDLYSPMTIFRLDRELAIARRKGLIKDREPTVQEIVADGIARGLVKRPKTTKR